MYFEWTYTQFVSQDCFLNILLHNTSMFALDSDPYLSFCLYNRSKALHKYERIRTTKQTLDDLLSTFQFDCREKSINFTIGNLSIQGTLKKRANCGQINVDLHVDSENKYSKWTVLIPHGSFDGKISIDNSVFHVNSIIYQDQQFGTLPVQSFLDKWCWGVLSNEEATRCCFSVLAQDGSAKTIKWTCNENSLDVTIEQVFYDNFYDALLPDIKHAFLPQIWNQPLKIQVNKDIPLRKRFREHYDCFLFSYFRYICSSEDRIWGVCEQMQIERNENK